jgi:hypothetical protein
MLRPSRQDQPRVRLPFFVEGRQMSIHIPARLPQIHTFQGSTTATGRSAKCAVFRVASVARLATIMPAFIVSRSSTGRPFLCRADIRSPARSAAALSKAATRFSINSVRTFSSCDQRSAPLSRRKNLQTESNLQNGDRGRPHRRPRLSIQPLYGVLVRRMPH